MMLIGCLAAWCRVGLVMQFAGVLEPALPALLNQIVVLDAQDSQRHLCESSVFCLKAHHDVMPKVVVPFEGVAAASCSGYWFSFRSLGSRSLARTDSRQGRRFDSAAVR